MNTRTRLGAAAVGLALIVSGDALGQGMVSADEEPATAKVKDVRPPAPSDPGKPAIVMPYLLTFVLGGLAVGLAVMPSGRSHQN